MTKDLEQAAGAELVLTSQTQGQLTRWSKPSLPDKLDALVSSNDSMAMMPVVGPQTAAILKSFYEHPEPPLADDQYIEIELVKLAGKPARKSSAGEAAFNLEVWIPVLKEFPRVDLGYAFGRLLRESKWFPDISEIIALAKYPANMRAAKKHQAWKLLHKHKTDWREPIPESELVTPEAIAQIKAEVDAEFPSNREEETK